LWIKKNTGLYCLFYFDIDIDIAPLFDIDIDIDLDIVIDIDIFPAVVRVEEGGEG